jgi:cation diffusion facilitator family transporter
VSTAPHPPAIARRHTAVALTSLVVAVALLAVKFWAYHLTGSQAVFSDALESIVNVVAAAVALFVVTYAGMPADRDHPFGHGKVEFFSAFLEGALVTAAAVLILWQAVEALLGGAELRRLELGLLLTLAAGVANGALGWWLVRYGRRHHSAAIEADGHHVLSDFWTSAAAVVGLLLVQLTDLAWLDPLVAGLMAFWLLWTGVGIVRRAAAALLDAEDPELLRQLVAMLGPRVRDGIIRIHGLRAIRSGHYRHISAHLVVPEFWTVDRAHTAAETLAAQVIAELPGDGEIDFHTDPCERNYCAMCDYEACSVRREPFLGVRPLTVDEAVLPDPEVHPTISALRADLR